MAKDEDHAIEKTEAIVRRFGHFLSIVSGSAVEC